MATITTYATLKQAVADWLARSDVDAVIPTFIANAEARLNRKVRTRQMETMLPVTFNSDGQVTLPGDYLEYRTLAVATTPAGRVELVEPNSEEFMFKYRPYANPQFAAITGDTLAVQPPYSGAGTLYYYQRIPALTDANTVNWLLTKSPECYLYAACLEGAIYLRDTAAAANYTELMMSAVEDLLQEDRAARASRTPVPPLQPAAKTARMDQ